jgi:hypothetical protein
MDVFDGFSVEFERIYKTSRRSLFTIAVARNVKSDDEISVVGLQPGIDGHDSVAH